MGSPNTPPTDGVRSRFRGREWLVLASIVLGYCMLSMALRADVFWSPDEGGKFIQTVSLSWGPGVEYDVPYPGKALDPALYFYPRWSTYPQPQEGGGFHANWSAGFPLLSRPFYELFGMRGIHVIPLVCGLASIFVMGWLANRPLSMATMLILAFATSICFYSLLFWEHTLAVLLSVSALAVFWNAKNRWLAQCLPILLMAAAIALRWEMQLCALAFGVAHLLHSTRGDAPASPRRLLPILGGVAFLGAVSALTFSPKIAGFAKLALARLVEPGFWASLPHRLEVCWFGVDPLAETATLPAFVPYLGCGGTVCCVVSAFIPRLRWKLMVAGAALVAIASVTVLVSTLRYRQIHGLFLPCPLIVFAFATAARDSLGPKQSRAGFLDTMAIAYWALGTLAVVFGVYGGPEWGPRYLLAAQVLLAATALRGYQRCRAEATPAGQRLLAVTFAILVLVSVGYQARGIAEIATTKNDIVQYRRAIKYADVVVVTDQQWLPAIIGPEILRRQIYVLHDPSDLILWLRRNKRRVNSFMLIVEETSGEEIWRDAMTAGYAIVLEETEVLSGLRFSRLSLGP